MPYLSKIITIIRNAEHASKLICYLPLGGNYSMVYAILTILRKNGIIAGFAYVNSTSIKSSKKVFVVYLAYDSRGKSVLNSIFCVSTAGRRVYMASNALWQPQGTTGFFIISTVYGLLTDIEARRYNVGGEILIGVT